jgi:pyruvate/2-oxoglutarate/acetoin dehydrogenase E1 component
MTYKETIRDACTEAGKDPKVVFLGYNVAVGCGGGVYSGVPVDQLIETPLAENLMTSLAVGMSLEGFRPVVYFERFDFILIALDSIINHLDKMSYLSSGQFKPAIILRVVAGNTKTPLFTGPTHTQNFADALRRIVTFPIYHLAHRCDILPCWETAYDRMCNGDSSMLVEYKDLYDK